MNELKYTPIIGLEIHVELKTKSKMFCGCKNDPFNAEKPNIYTCPVCLGLPGALPVPNRKAVEWCILLGLALNCRIPKLSKFDRKNYFYPDLPKGYQISQYDQPLAVNGFMEIEIGDFIKKIGITRVHLEEDTGKLIHAQVDGENATLIDFNRSGVPLVEIVTEPDIGSSEEAKIFLKKLHQIIRYLDISDADMEKGSMRLEPNVSLQKPSEKNLPKYKVEIKNINSFAFAKKAIDYELERHEEILKEGKIPFQETRGWNEKKSSTQSQRSKEEAHDYRYFPEPDIPPMRWIKQDVENIKRKIPELPDIKRKRFIDEYLLSKYDATILTDTIDVANYFEQTVKLSHGQPTTKVIANWIINKKVDFKKTSPQNLITLIQQNRQTIQFSEKELTDIINKIVNLKPKAVADFKNGKQASLMFLIGMVMREIKGKADANSIRSLLLKVLQ